MSRYRSKNEVSKSRIVYWTNRFPSANDSALKVGRYLTFLFLFGIALVVVLTASKRSTVAASAVTEGMLRAVDGEGNPNGLCPLRHTDVKAAIGGFLARVTVTQEFENPFRDKIEAVYTFPLPQNAAVDDMTLTVGERVVKGKIKRREEAQAIYQAARAAGHVAGLLDQERPNIFTQSVANIMPGEKVKVTISYVETLKYEEGTYEFIFPMVVGPRYIPGTSVGKQGGGWSQDTDRVPDASRITPPVTPKGTRAGHDISVEVLVDAGVPIRQLRSTLHDIDVRKIDSSASLVRLKDKAVIPNKDFILKYEVGGGAIQDGLLAHRGKDDGFFMLLLQPPERVSVEDVTPKELVFVLDTSGSMSGFPIEKAKETMKLALDGLYPQDTFNLITFSGDTHILFPKPVPAIPENLSKAQEFLASRYGSGGTEMMTAIRAALEPSDAQDHVRIVCFMTDGYVGNDMEIISEVQKHPNARVFAFGIGSAVNRFLLDKMAEYGRGEVEYVTLDDDGSAAARRFHERIRKPLLTDISIDWSGLPVTDVYPKRIPDLFSAKPLFLYGRFTREAHGTIQLNGRLAGRPFTRRIPVDFPRSEPQFDVLATLWARTRIDDLMGHDYEGIQRGNARADIREEIAQLGLQYRLMTQFTSFVAVEEVTVTDGGEPRRIEVPVEMPEGVSYEGVFGDDRARAKPVPMSVSRTTFERKSITPQLQRGVVGGVAGGVLLEAREMDAAANGRPLSPQEQKRQQLLLKLDPNIVSVIERLKNKNSRPGVEDARFVKNGKAEIQIWLNKKSPEVLVQLKQLGFELVAEPKTANLVIGRLPIERLAELVEIKEVRYVAAVQVSR